MREPMSISDQVNAFNKSNHQRLVISRTMRQRRPVYSSFNTVHGDEDDIELKTLSFDVYTNKHLVASGKSILPYPENTRLDKLLLPSINKDINNDENRRRRKRRRPAYRKSLFHSYSFNSTEADLASLTARGTKPETQITITTPTIKDDDTIVSFQRHHAPPPSPSDDEIERLLYELQDRNQSRSPTRQSPIEKEGYIPFRLPVLNHSPKFGRSSSNSPSKDIRSTLSNYLQKYY